MTRPYTRFNDTLRNEFIKLLESGMRPGKAAKAIGVTYTTIRSHRNADPDFDKACDLAEIEGLEPVEDKLYELALAGDLPAIKTILFNRNKGRWQDMRRTQTDVNVHQTIEIEAGDRLSRIEYLRNRLEERKALREGNIIDAEVVDTTDQEEDT